ncbi:DEAD/DEAH box helicase [Gleimia europaea]|uniref:DEAD/DEAH box helicase n=1 Tax=Gleimia europaea ACS-120-V-Col10b TaxID=883069 RepID=A0A9W5VVK3_9ACTO|nr:DEAD/DEAH box helicase [Gleimia europaea]EPD29329.1 hypothetical protein HMPREF9238_01641 [Gleimia europaea ACS-120-V-Col10b]
MSPALNELLDDLEDGGNLENSDALYEAFTGWAKAGGRPLYPHQEEAFIELLSGNHVIAATPTGSGKSMIALAAHLISLARGGRSYYTAPLKALVSEKFFDLVALFGSQNVGMITGDASVNPDAPIICCTAEILANQSLREGESLDADMVIMDEFHFYGDPERGWAWQVPLLELTRPQFVLMSATLGDVSFFVEDLRGRTGRDTAVIDNAKRPVPLEMAYSKLPLADSVTDLIESGKYPIYIVHFGQKAAVQTAHSLASANIISKRHAERIKEAISGFRFGKGFGQILRGLLVKGVGVHHAGMLPRYRRLVERLTQQGVLAAICGTDTLGVGINVPITTVLLTSLVKFDGRRERHLNAREFHQIAGRAGRAGFDEVGWVVVEAPEHVIENRLMEIRAGDDPKKLKKLVRKKLPEGRIGWSESTFERLEAAAPEPLHSQFEITHSMVLNVLANPIKPTEHLLRLATDNHDPHSESNPHLRRLGQIYSSLRQAGVIEKLSSAEARKRNTDRLQLVRDLPDDFALNQPLSPFALAALELLDPEAETYALDVVSVVEAVLEDPRPLLFAQQNEAKGEAVAAMKAAGMEYEERMEALETVTWPKPLADLLEPAFETFAKSNPWVGGLELAPKSVVRLMVENAMTFSELVSRFDVARSEGVILRYLMDAYRALRQIVPDSMMTDELTAIIEWLGELIRAVDSSLLDEWEALSNPDADRAAETDLAQEEVAERAFGAAADGSVSITANQHYFYQQIRNAIFERVDRFALDDLDGLVAFGDTDGSEVWEAARWENVLDRYYAEYDWVGAGPEARSKARYQFVANADAVDLAAAGVSDRLIEANASIERAILVTYTFEDEQSDGDWRLIALVDLERSASENRPVFHLLDVGPR